MGWIGIRSLIDWSRTITSLVMESIRARPVPVSMSVTRVSHSEDSQGVSSGTGRRSSGRFSMAATRRSMAEYCSTSGPPTS